MKTNTARNRSARPSQIVRLSEAGDSLPAQDDGGMAALLRARVFAEPLLTGRQLDTGEDALAHADGMAVIEDAPNLAGETNIYLDTQLKAFRTGKRKHDIMSEVAAGMTDEEIRAVADWYSQVKLEISPAQ